MSAPSLRVSWLGRAPYEVVETEQEALRCAVLEGRGEEAFLLVEHEAVVTLGRHADDRFLRLSAQALAGLGVALRRSRRGGDVTYHGPGQLVGYPVVRVGKAVRAHVEAMATAICEALEPLGVRPVYRADRPGLWLGEDKLAAFGVHVSRGVAIHGFALNVTTPPAAFGVIVPCGLVGCGVTSLHLLVPEPPSLERLGRTIAARFAAHTGRVALAG